MSAGATSGPTEGTVWSLDQVAVFSRISDPRPLFGSRSDHSKLGQAGGRGSAPVPGRSASSPASGAPGPWSASVRRGAGPAPRPCAGADRGPRPARRGCVRAGRGACARRDRHRRAACATEARSESLSARNVQAWEQRSRAPESAESGTQVRGAPIEDLHALRSLYPCLPRFPCRVRRACWMPT